MVENGRARVRFHLAAAAGQRLVLAEQVFLADPSAAGGAPRPPARPLRAPARAPGDGPEQRRGVDADRPDREVAREWRIYTDVAGAWTLWPRLFRARDGSSFALRRQADVYVRRGAAWRLLVWPHECDFGLVTFDDPKAR